MGTRIHNPQVKLTAGVLKAISRPPAYRIAGTYQDAGKECFFREPADTPKTF